MEKIADHLYNKDDIILISLKFEEGVTGGKVSKKLFIKDYLRSLYEQCGDILPVSNSTKKGENISSGLYKVGAS